MMLADLAAEPEVYQPDLLRLFLPEQAHGYLPPETR
jgi:hypothetical protein